MTRGRFNDLTGQTFGQLTVLYRVENRNNEVFWRCKCSCGVEKDISASSLRRGHAKSCGCAKAFYMSEGLHKDLAGKRFGRLVAIEYLGKSRWLCKCDCGNDTIVLSSALVHGSTESCGCLARELRIEGSRKSLTTHGKRYTRLYSVWASMKNRCYNPHEKSYRYYGGRGISICAEWLNDFAAFYEWAMSNGYDPNAPKGKCTIDRIDVNGNYEPSNCRWVDMATQNKNRRKHTSLESQALPARCSRTPTSTRGATTSTAPKGVRMTKGS